MNIITGETPRMGDKSLCRMCDKPIEYVGYWRHQGTWKPRHPALPTLVVPPSAPARQEEGQTTTTGQEPCYYCGAPTCSVAGDPGEWPLYFCHADDPGQVKAHHIRCVTERLDDQQRARNLLDIASGNMAQALAERDQAQAEVARLRSAIKRLAVEVIERWPETGHYVVSRSAHLLTSWKPPATPTPTDAEAGRVERLEEALKEMYEAMLRYQSDSEGEAPATHRAMMRRVRLALNISRGCPVSGECYWGNCPEFECRLVSEEAERALLQPAAAEAGDDREGDGGS